MKFTRLAETTQSQSNVEVFGGYNHNIRIEDGEFFDMKNLTSSSYPVLSPRKKRGHYIFPEDAEGNVNGVIYKDSLIYVIGTDLYINDTKVDGITLTDGKKQLISMGAYLIIMPDKKYINTKDLEDYGNIEIDKETTGTVTYSICRVDGTEYEDVTVSDTAPSNPTNMQYWLDTSSTPHTLKQYSSSSSMWTFIATTYIRIQASGIASGLKQYDAVKISGIDSSLTQLHDLEGQTSVLWEVHEDTDGNGANDYIVVVGILDEVSTQTTALTIERKMPIMDFVIESNNRLWGCRYGENADGEVVNEIYASKLGDFKNWFCYMGISSDSYAASCGTDGQWTGAITHLGYPLFFKENVLHKVFGNYPSNYQIQTTACRGVQRGAGNSLAIVNETLFYKSRNGVCVYDGSLPQEISTDFGEIHYTAVDETNEDTLRNGASAGAIGNKYYISMKSEEDTLWHMFVYDVSYGLWHKEDNTKVSAFCTGESELYYINAMDKDLYTVNGSGAVEEDDIEWMAETGVIGTNIKTSSRRSSSLPGKKYISQLLIRMSLGIGSRVMIYIQYDSCGQWDHISTMTGTTLRSFNLPIRPKRCDHFRIRILGRGEAKMYSMTKTIERGSDL